MTAALPAGDLRSVLPEVHGVRADDRYIYVESAALTLHSFGAVEANGIEAPLGIRHFMYRFPRYPRRAEGRLTQVPFGVIGAFVNGVPIYPAASAVSYQGQNIWHVDAVAAAKAPAPSVYPHLIGYAFDGFPVYSETCKSSYRLRDITKRAALPDGTQLTPAQEGPAVSAQFPLGTFAEDYEYVPGSGDLDEHNGRIEPDGTYAYCLSAYPYLIGPTYYGQITPSELTNAAHADRPAITRTGRLAPDHITAGEAVELTLALPTRFPENVHERPIHLVAVSKDLQIFAHIHPELQPDGYFTVSHTFPKPGKYWLFADYTLPGQPQTIGRYQISVEGDPVPAYASPAPGFHVAMAAAQPLRAGEDITFRFSVDTTDLEPYLGSWAHIMIVSADGKHFIHAHPDAATPNPDPWSHTHAVPGPSPSNISTTAGFSEPGRYRLWVQFQRSDEVFSFPFDLTVAPALSVAKPGTPVANAIHIQVTHAGFTPGRITIPANQAVRLAFERMDAENCASAVVFPALGIRRDLPAGRTTVIELPSTAPGEVGFSCGMGMYKGAEVVR
jgi:hypothetical protein